MQTHIVESSFALCGSFYTNKTGCLHGAKPTTASERRRVPPLCTQHHMLNRICRPCSPAQGARRWRPRCVCAFPTGSWGCSLFLWLQAILFIPSHICWPQSPWPVAAPTLAAQPAVPFFPLIKHALLFLKLHLSKSQHVMGILDRRASLQHGAD